MLGSIKGYIRFNLFLRNYRRMNFLNNTYPGNIFDLDKVVVGKKTYGTLNVVDWSPKQTKLQIGSYCSISPGVRFLLGGEHQLSSISTYPFKVRTFDYLREAGSKGDIRIEDDVWIGADSLICSGISIGRGAVIAAGTVVTKNVEPYSIVGGCPGKLIKYRFPEAIRKTLLALDIVALFDSFTEDKIGLIYSDLNESNYTEVISKLGSK